MQQHYDHYTNEDQEVWRILFDRQTANLADKASTEYLSCLEQLNGVLNAGSIPNFTQLNRSLEKATGWTIEVVPGHIPVDDFFGLLAQRKFPSSTWLRRKDQLDYLEEPDMFHDIYGHIPLLADRRYASFMQRVGALGVASAGDADAVKALRSLYWFTIEFGILREGGARRIYGAGLISSYAESIQVVEGEVACLPFDIHAIMQSDFRTDALQELYFEARDFQGFLKCVGDVEKRLERSHAVASTSR